MKIYTKKGDTGKTSLFGGTRLSKAHIRIESYGNVDELNAHIGLLRDQEGCEPYSEVLKEIQEELFTIGSHLAADPGKENLWLPPLDNEMIARLENNMDSMNNDLPELKYFILPGGHPTVSQCHICRCVCRRAERTVVALFEVEKGNILIIKFLNRLSDYFFVLARHIAHQNGIEDVKWEPRKAT